MKSKVNSKNCLIVAIVAVAVLIIGVLMVDNANTLWDEHLSRVVAGNTLGRNYLTKYTAPSRNVDGTWKRI